MGCPSPPGCVPSQSFGSSLLRWDSGAPVAAAKYDLAPGTFASDGTFTTSAVNRAGPDDTASVSGQAVDLDADQLADRVVAEVTFADGAQDLTLDGVPNLDYDHYKCWDADDALCKPAVKATARSVTPLGGSRFAASADVLYKYAVPDLAAPLTHLVGGYRYQATSGSGGGTWRTFVEFGGSLGTPPLELTNTRTGDDFAGSVHVDVDLLDGGANSNVLAVVFGVAQPTGSSVTSNDAECPVP